MQRKEIWAQDITSRKLTFKWKDHNTRSLPWYVGNLLSPHPRKTNKGLDSEMHLHGHRGPLLIGCPPPVSLPCTALACLGNLKRAYSSPEGLVLSTWHLQSKELVLVSARGLRLHRLHRAGTWVGPVQGRGWRRTKGNLHSQPRLARSHHYQSVTSAGDSRSQEGTPWGGAELPQAGAKRTKPCHYTGPGGTKMLLLQKDSIQDNHLQMLPSAIFTKASSHSSHKSLHGSRHTKEINDRQVGFESL